MKLNSKDISDLMNDDNEYVDVRHKDADIGTIPNRIQKIRKAVAEKKEDVRVYGNKDKSRFKH